MKITILGCGASTGVPVIGCSCSVCNSGSKFNKRYRTSALIECQNTKILIDTSPDLRMQAINNLINCIDGILYTHYHFDHCVGISELEVFTPKNNFGFIPIYSDSITLSHIISARPDFFIQKNTFHSIRACSYLTANLLERYDIFNIGDCEIIMFEQIHGNITSNGFLINKSIAYCTDIKSFPEKTLNLLVKNVKVLVIDCLRYGETKAHLNFSSCIEMIKIIKPEIAVLTHMGHEVDYHIIINQLFELVKGCNIIPAYDGLVIQI